MIRYLLYMLVFVAVCCVGIAETVLNVPNLSVMGDKGIRGEQTRVNVSVENFDLVIFFECFESNIKGLHKSHTGRDGALWSDDCVEVFIDSNSDKDSYYHFIVGAGGGVADALCRKSDMTREFRWDGDWKADVKIYEDRWTARLIIPLYNFRIGDNGSKWRINFCRERHAGSGQTYYTYAPVKASFHEPQAFMPINLPISDVEYLSLRVGDWWKYEQADKRKTVWKIPVTNKGNLPLGLKVQLTAKGNSTKSYHKIINVSAGKSKVIKFSVDSNITSYQCMLELVSVKTDKILFKEICPEKVISMETDSAVMSRFGNGRIRIDGNLLMYIDDEPFFPLGFFLVVSEHNKDGLKSYELIKKAGFNIVIDYLPEWSPDNYTPMILNKLRANHLYLIPSVRTNRDKAFVEKYKNEPLILSWYIADEPEIAPEKLVDKYRNIRKVDSTRPVCACYSIPSTIYKYQKSNDIIMVDPYPKFGSKNIPMSIVSNFMDIAYKAVNYRKPVWSVLQCYRDGVEKGRFPTWDEYRVMAYLALNHGSRGIIFWEYSWSKCGTITERGGWPALKALAKELQQMWKVYVFGREFDLGQDNKISQVETKGFSYNGDRYLIIVNRTYEPANVSLRLKEFNYQTLYLVGNSERTLRGLSSDKTDVVNVTLKPCETRIYTSNERFACSLDFSKIRSEIQRAEERFHNRVTRDVLYFKNGVKPFYAREKKIGSNNHSTNPYLAIDGSRYSSFVDTKNNPPYNIELILSAPKRISRIDVYLKGSAKIVLQKINGEMITLRNSKDIERGIRYEFRPTVIKKVICRLTSKKAVLYEIEAYE